VCEAVARAGGCRVVVAGSYHAAVFALAQGVPAVGVARSPYYATKMEGLRERFGGRFEVVRIGGRRFEDRLAAAVDAAWRTPPEERAALLAAAERQVEAGRAAYAKLVPIVVG
jgi:colanic acid/amylovoran biosynthesis protein